MKRVRPSTFVGFLRAEDGQTTIMLCAMMVMLMGMTGLTLDVGKALFTYKVLQATTDAAALAGASALPASTATTTATKYSAVTGNLNARANLPNVNMVAGYPKIKCLNTIANDGITCGSPSNGNALQVKQTISVPLTFMRVLGISQLTMTASATAAAKGAQRAPYNVAIIVDSTGSMGGTDSDSQCNTTRLSCALAGVQVLLQNLSPCAPNLSTCGAVTNGNVSKPYDRVALYTFPSLYSSTDVQHEYDCSGTKPQVNYYTDGSTGKYTGPASIYKILDYSSDYKTSASTTTLNPNSNLVKAVGGVAGCGMQPINMYTYIAGVLYTAGLDLINLDSSDTTHQGVVVILTDGDMNTPAQYLPNADPSSGAYASQVKQCAQAGALAAYANYYSVRVYAVAYGATDSGCSTDTSGITPCQDVQSLASSPDYFYSDYTSTGGSSTCISASHPSSNLNQIFTQIANSLSTGRLIPDNTT